MLLANMTKHTCITDLSNNFYKATQDLSEPIIVTNRGKPTMSISAFAASSTPLNGGAMFEAQSLSVFNSKGFSDTEAESMAKDMRKLFEKNTVKGVTNEKIDNNK